MNSSPTKLIIAHRLSTVRKGDRIFVLDHGKIVQNGPHDELILNRDSFYSKLVEKQFNN